MLFSNSITLIVVTRDRLIRADFASARAAEPISVIARERPHIDDPATLVETAIGFDKRKPGRVFVLSSDVWTHTLPLASTNTHGLSAEDLQQMLNFEAEPLSGNSAFEVTSAALPLYEAAGQKHFWLTQVATSVREQIDEAVRKLGGRLAGIAHPGGVPYSFDESSSVGIAARVEFWPGAAVRVACIDGSITKALIDDGAVASNWLAATDDWKRQSGTTQVAAVVPENPGGAYGADYALPDEALPPFYSLDHEETLVRWLSAWRRALTAKIPAIPLIVPAPRRLTQQQRNKVSLVLGLVVLVACYGHHRWVVSDIDKTAAEKARLEAPGIELNAVKTQFAALEKEMKKLDEEKTKLAGDVSKTEAVFASHRRRLAEMMRRLSEVSSDDWVLQQISGTGREIKLTGTTMHPEHISTLTSQLTNDFGRLGWAVDPARQQARHLTANGGPWTFEIRLRDLMPVAPAPTPSATSPSATTPPSTIVRVPAP